MMLEKEEIERYINDGLTEEQISLFVNNISEDVKDKILEVRKEYHIDLYDLFDLLRYIYIAQNIRSDRGALYINCLSYGVQENYIHALSEIGLITDYYWTGVKLGILHTTTKGDKIASVLVEQYMKTINISELEKKYGDFLLYYLYDKEIYRCSVGFSHSRDVIDEFGYNGEKGTISPLYNWCAEYFEKQLDLFEYLEDKKIAVRANFYVSTKGGRINNKYILVAMDEFRQFLKANEEQLQKQKYRKELQNLQNELAYKFYALKFIDIYNYENYIYEGIGSRLKDEIILLISKLKNDGVIELEEKYIQNKKLTRPPYRVIDKAYPGVVKGLLNDYEEYASSKIEQLLEAEILPAKETEQEISTVPIPILPIQSEVHTKPIEQKPQTSSTAKLTFPTATDEDEASYVLGRGDFSKKFVLGMNDREEYISLPWNGNESHISMFCGTGTGKSTLASSIVLQSAFQRIPVVIFDPKDGWGISLIKSIQEMMNSLDEQKHNTISERFELTRQSMCGFDFSQPQYFKINGVEYNIEYKIFTFDETVREKITVVSTYKIPLINIPAVYRSPDDNDQKYLRRFKDTCDMLATSFIDVLPLKKKDIPYNAEISLILEKHKDTGKGFFTRDEFINLLKNHSPQELNQRQMDQLVQAVITYCTSNSKFIARDDTEVTPINEVFNNPFIEDNNKITISVFDIQSIGAMVKEDKSKVMTMYASSITGQIFDYINKKNPPKGKGYEIGMPKVWLIYDEAHNLIEEGKTTANNNIKRILQEGRSLGAYAAIISQKPQGVDITARAQAKNRIYADVTWDSIHRDLNVSEEIKSRIKEKVNNSKKATKKMTFVNDNYPEGELIYPLTSPQCVLAKTDMLSLI